MKRTVTQRTENVFTPVKNQFPHVNPDYGHQDDQQNAEDARKGTFGTKADLKAKLSEVKEKYPGLHITHRHNNTAR